MKKLLLIGWDAADWKIAAPLMDQGRMPHLKSLVERGVMGNLATLQPPLSPMMWTSIATGKRPYKHGIHGFTEPDLTGGIRPISSLSRKTRALWNMLQLEGLRCNVVGWWPSHPAEPIAGVMVSNHYQTHVANLGEPWPLRPGTVHPARLAEPLAELRVHPQELDGDMLRLFVPRADEIDQEKDQRLYAVAKTLAETASIQAAATAIMQLEPWDFMAVYFDGIDHLGHGFMKYHPPRQPWISEEDYALYKGVVEGAYLFHDAMLGAMLRLIDQDTAVMLVSDHGFHPDRLRPERLPNEPAGPAEEHRPFGVIAAAGPGFERDALVFGASLLDVTPTLLHWYGLPVGRDMDGKPLLGMLAEPRPPAFIDTWDARPGNDGSHPAGAKVDTVDARASLEQLVELGYIERPDADRDEAVRATVRELRYNLARAYLDAARPADALPILEALWRDWPGESRFGVQTFGCLLTLERVDEARAALERIEASKARYAAEAVEELRRLNQEWQEAGKTAEDLDTAEAAKLRRLRARAGLHGQALAFLRARLLRAEGRLDEALERLEQAATAQTHNLPSVHLQQGEIHLQRGRLPLAETAFAKALELEPENAYARLGLASVRLARRDHAGALEAALASLGLVYHNPRAHCVCGEALLHLHRFDEARTALATAIAQNPVFPKAHELIARIHRSHLPDDAKARHHDELARAARTRIREERASGRPGADVDGLLGSAWAEEVLRALPEPLPADAPLAESLVVVSGLPRAGTSMMMQMLDAGGLPLVSDGQRSADADNPKGYYELDAVKRLHLGETDWCQEARGRAVKVVAPLLSALPRDIPLRIVFMDRALSEVVASQRAMLARQGKPSAPAETLARTYRRQLEGLDALLDTHPRIRLLRVSHRDTLDDPLKTAIRVDAFLGGGFDVNAMARSVDPRLHRQRAARSA
jgi:predicted AlkP superfamily phosphohydrolase/phosphomutase/tetratricopeptide (TPR) repeat protein